MSGQLRFSLAQMNPVVGDITSNAEQVIELAKEAHSQQHADVVVFPELALTGYPPEDYLFHSSFLAKAESELTRISQSIPEVVIIVGHPTIPPQEVIADQGRAVSQRCYNSASVLFNGKVETTYHKLKLPNYRVFDEKRYFLSGHDACVFNHKGVNIGITICEDLWYQAPAKMAKDQGAEVLVNINASPFYLGKSEDRKDIIKARVQENHLPIVYLNMVGGQDEMVFDGASVVVGADGNVEGQMPFANASLASFDFDNAKKSFSQSMPEPVKLLSDEAQLYQSLVLGVKDYIRKNGFTGAVVGLSGGIDSALTLCIAVDAVGAANVKAIMMPSRYTSQMSLQDAASLASNLGVQYEVISIEPMFEAFNESLAPLFSGLAIDETEQNLQARCRGTLLMAVSNKTGELLLTTGNKSEMAVGYCTLYGDMAGGFSVLKDVNKAWVYRLSEYCNRDVEVIPRRIIERPPSAELASDQKDEDSLPPYDVLDEILRLYIEDCMSLDEIANCGFDKGLVAKIIQMIKRSEHKRFQSPPGPRITHRAFGKDWRYPLTARFKE